MLINVTTNLINRTRRISDDAGKKNDTSLRLATLDILIQLKKAQERGVCAELTNRQVEWIGGVQ